MHTNKPTLRDTLYQKRRKNSLQYRTQASQMIFLRLLPYIRTIQPKTIHCYLATSYEVQTADIITYAHANNISVYSWLPSNEDYLPTRITPETSWYSTQKGVPIPNSQPVSTLPRMDLIIPPLLGFDQHCNRLGHGQGTYDRFLAQQPQAITIGLAYEQQQVPRISCEPHDVPLDYIITEHTTYTQY